MEIIENYKEQLINYKENIQDVFVREVFSKWKPFLLDDTLSSVNDLDNKEKAFLLLINKNYENQILPKIKPLVLNEFQDYYGDIDEKIEIALLHLDIIDGKDGVWQLIFEDDTQDPLVHVYFSEGRFDYCAMTC